VVKKLSVVISCFNEQENLERYPQELIEPLGALNIPFEIVLVDDHSTDSSADLIRRLQKQFPFVVGAFHPENRGLGAGLRTGFSLATGDAIATLDGDLTFHPNEIPTLLNEFDNYTDVVMGSPFRGRLEGVPLFRRILSKGVNFIYQRLIGRELTAFSSIFRVYRASFLKKMVLTSTSFDINIEILFRALREHARVKEVPVTLSSRTRGESKIRIGREIKNHLKMMGKILLWKVST
jgi:glycosyltransferase involved in cell wall biosynthesis